MTQYRTSSLQQQQQEQRQALSANIAADVQRHLRHQKRFMSKRRDMLIDRTTMTASLIASLHHHVRHSTP